MAKFFGEIGYAETKETAPDVWEEVIVKRNYSGDVIRNSRRLENSGNLNDNITLDNLISIVADAYAEKNFSTIRYVKWMGVSWKVTKVEAQRPRLILTMGDVYNKS